MDLVSDRSVHGEGYIERAAETGQYEYQEVPGGAFREGTSRLWREQLGGLWRGKDEVMVRAGGAFRQSTSRLWRGQEEVEERAGGS